MLELPFTDETEARCPPALQYTLAAAGVYNLVWGAAVVLLPGLAFQIAGMQPPLYPQIWQCVGMIVGVYGVGYLLAARDPYRHWPIVLVGLLGKLFGPLGFLYYATLGEMPWSWGIVLLFNDLIWWAPFAAILYQAAKAHSDTGIGRPHDIDDATAIFPSQHGRSLLELSSAKPVMVVFLRHFGCSFCREALHDLSAARGEIEALGLSLALVHMSHPEEAAATLKKYNLEDINHFSDGNCEIYRAFGLERGAASQLFGWRVCRRGAAAMLRGNMIGALAGDGFRMPGLFFVEEGQIRGGYRHRTAADRPDYVDLARRFTDSLPGDPPAESVVNNGRA